MKGLTLFIVIFSCLVLVCSQFTADDLKTQLETFYKQNNIMALDVQIFKDSYPYFKATFGYKDIGRSLKADNNTVYRMASLSKSITAAGLMLLIKEQKVKFTDTLSKIFGFPIENPFFPGQSLTVQMILTHQSSYIQGPSYDKFLTDTYYNSKSGADIPNISQIFLQNGRYYNESAFDSKHPPGTYYRYANLNYLLAGTIIQKVSGQRFDLFMKERLLSKFSDNMSFNPELLKDANDLAVLYQGKNGSWIATKDNYNGKIPIFNMTGYVAGTNAGYYGPQGSIRASVTDLAKFIDIIRCKGAFRGLSVIPSDLTQEMIKPRYQYHGPSSGGSDDFHAYGTGLFTTTYRTRDNFWNHRAVVGHVGDAYGLASGFFYYQNYSIAYVMSGILNGYTSNSYNRFTVQRQIIHNLTQAFLYP